MNLDELIDNSVGTYTIRECIKDATDWELKKLLIIWMQRENRILI